MILDGLSLLFLVLVAYRATRFFVFDSLIGFNLESKSRMSRRLDLWGYDANGMDRSWLRGKVTDLLVCSFCLGAWLSLAASCVWLRVWPWELGINGWFTVAAIAGGQALLSQFDHALGHLTPRRQPTQKTPGA